MKDAVRPRSPKQANPRIATEGTDLDRAASTDQPCNHLQVAPVERSYLNVGEPLAGTALADLAEYRVLGLVQTLDVASQGRVLVAERLVHDLFSTGGHKQSPCPAKYRLPRIPEL